MLTSAAAAAADAGGGASSRPSSGGSSGGKGKRRSSGGGRGKTKTPPQASNPGDLLRFEFDGDAINGEIETAETLDLEGDEVFDVHVLR